MARKSIVISWQRKKEKHLQALRQGKEPQFPTRVYNRCEICHRVRGYLGFFGVCRICFRELACNGEVPGVTKASW